MNKTFIKKSLITLFTVVCLFSVWSLSVQAAGVSKVIDYTVNYTTKKPVFKKDVTGDGKADTVNLTYTKTDSDYLDKVNVMINGKKAATVDAKYCYGVVVNYISMSKSKVFLQIYTLTDGDYIVNNGIYKYNKGTKKLKKILDLNKVSGGSYIGAMDVTSASSSQIKVACRVQPPETGCIEFTYTFTYKNGKFVLNSNSVAAKSMFIRMPGYDQYAKYFKKNQFVAFKTLKFYKDTKLKKVSFTAAKGNILKLQKIKISGKKTYVQFKKGTKTGWIRVFNDYPVVYPNYDNSGWFHGVIYRLAG